MQLLSEFFRDAISRVVPGLVAIFILGQQFTATMPAKFNDSPTIFAFVIVVAAWLIGVMIDFLPVAVLGVAMRKLASSNSLKAGKFTRFLSRKAMEYHEKNLPVTPRTHEEVLATALRTASRIKDQSQDAANRILWDSHRQIQKHDAEKIMFRSLFLIFLLAFISSGYQLPDSILDFLSRLPRFVLDLASLLPTPQPVLGHYSKFYYCLICVLFFLAWYWCKLTVPRKEEDFYSGAGI